MSFNLPPTSNTPGGFTFPAAAATSTPAAASKLNTFLFTKLTDRDILTPVFTLYFTAFSAPGLGGDNANKTCK